MKWFYRGGLICICILMWTCLWQTAVGIHKSVREVPYKDGLSFPCYLQGTDVYLWSLSSGTDGAQLVLQNIGTKTISFLEIVFLSCGEEFVFRTAEILPGEKTEISEYEHRPLWQQTAVKCKIITVR